MDIAIDFDGTVVKHRWPAVGEDIPFAIDTLKRIIENGHKIILFTMRSGPTLEDAVDWYDRNDIPLYGINTNPDQSSWTQSPKAYAQLYIDDAALGCPLLSEAGARPYVDWKAIAVILEERGIIKSRQQSS